MSARRRREQIDGDFFEGEEHAALPELDIRSVDEVGFGGLALPIVQQQDGTVKLGHFHVTTTGLNIDGRITQDEWWAFFDGVLKIETAIQFIIGDLAAYGEEAFRISYDEIATRTGYKTETVENYAYVARNVPIHLRQNALSFNHHYLVASLDSHDEITRWLDLAAEHGLSVRNLELALNIWRDGGDPRQVFDIVDDQPSPVQKARLKAVRERTRVLKKARSKKARQQWLTYAQEQAAAWRELAGQIETLENED